MTRLKIIVVQYLVTKTVFIITSYSRQTRLFKAIRCCRVNYVCNTFLSDLNYKGIIKIALKLCISNNLQTMIFLLFSVEHLILAICVIVIYMYKLLLLNFS